jgi:twinkle protein
MHNWSDFKIEFQKIENNIEYETYCPKCNNQHNIPTLYINIDEESWFCKHCGFSGTLYQGQQNISPNNIEPWKLNPYIKNYQPNLTISKVAIENFKKKKITEQTLQHFKIGQAKVYFPNLQDLMTCLIFPYYQNQRLSNLVYFYGKNRSSEIGGVVTCFNYDSIENEETYIVYDELEVFSLFEAGKQNVISLFGGFNYANLSIEKIQNQALSFLSNIEEKIQDVKKFIIAMPSTEIGEAIKDELIRRLGREKCWVVQPPEKDYTWNKILIDYGKNKLNGLLEIAKPIPIKGIFEIDDIEEKFDELYYKGLRKGYETGFPTLNDYYTVVPGQWTVITGIPGHGKSNFLDALMVNLAKHHDFHFGIFSPENQPIARHFASILEKYYESPFDLGRHNRISEEEKELGKIWLKKHFSIILPDEDDNWSIDGVLNLAKVLVYRKGIKGLVIDPWNELDHSRPSNQTETEYVSSVLTKIRQFARNYDVHVWLVAHPAKLYKNQDGKYPVPTPYDISGSAHYRNKADNAITVWRNVGHEDQNVADIHIQKIRFKEVGKVGLVSLRYDSIAGVFIDDIDQNKRIKALENNEIIPTDKMRRLVFHDD